MPKKHEFAILLLFFASGASALIYEVIWTRQLTYVFGATFFAVSTILAAFMGGLALGSYLGGRYIDNRTNPLRIYGLLEIAIASSALALPLMVNAAMPVYVWVYKNFQTSSTALNVLRFAVNFALFLIPTTMMGATLPVLSRLMERQERKIGTGAGMLYASNTAGAFIGCLWAGFIGIAVFGLKGSTHVAVIINLAAGLIALWFSRGMNSLHPFYCRVERETENDLYPPTPVYSRGVIAAFLAAYALSGMTALGYQVVWSRSLIFAFDYFNRNTTYAFTMVLAVFLIGLSLGSVLMSRLGARIRNPLGVFSGIQIAIGLTAVLSMYLIVFVAPHLTLIDPVDGITGAVSWGADKINMFLRALAAILLPTVLMGMTFPLAVRIYISRLSAVGHGIGRVYAFNTVGAIVGAFLPGFVLFPLLGITKTLVLFAVTNVLSATVLMVMNPQWTKRTRRTFAVAGIAVSLALPALVPQNIGFFKVGAGKKVLFYEEGPLDIISVAEHLNGRFRRVAVDGMEVGGTDPIMLTDQKTLAHMPMLLLRSPKSALTFGFGTGGASYSFLLHKELERLDCVEISPTILKTAPLLEASNHGLMRGPKDPRFKIIIDDARNYLRMNDVLYDIIEIDCTDISYKANASLYSLEYFQLCRKRLSRDGAVVVWMPLKYLPDRAFRSVLHTFSRVFPHIQIWYFSNYDAHYVLLFGTQEELIIDYRLMLSRLSDARVKSDLAEINMDSPLKILSGFVTDQRRIKDVFDGAPLNTEDYPYVEFYAPRSKFDVREKQKIENLNLLLKRRGDIFPYLTNIPQNEVDALGAGLKRYAEALPFIIIGHNYISAGQIRKGCSAYESALKITPDDLSVVLLNRKCGL